MNVSKKTLAVIYRAAIWQNWNGSFLLNQEIYNAIARIVPLKDLAKFYPSGVEEIQAELQKIGKPNKRKKNRKAKQAKKESEEAMKFEVGEKVLWLNNYVIHLATIEDCEDSACHVFVDYNNTGRALICDLYHKTPDDMRRLKSRIDDLAYNFKNLADELTHMIEEAEKP